VAAPPAGASAAAAAPPPPPPPRRSNRWKLHRFLPIDVRVLGGSFLVGFAAAVALPKGCAALRAVLCAAVCLCARAVV
jgi:hypothetical protein